MAEKGFKQRHRELTHFKKLFGYACRALLNTVLCSILFPIYELFIVLIKEKVQGSATLFIEGAHIDVWNAVRSDAT